MSKNNPSHMNVKDIFEELSICTDNLYVSKYDERKEIIARILVLTYELQRRFQ